jgi:SAM-dependent methyltransferase
VDTNAQGSLLVKEFSKYYVKLANTLQDKQSVRIFLYDEAIAINIARLTHLESLGLPIESRTMLEVGSGIGLLTKFFEDKNCRIISTEARMENIQANLESHPYRNGSVFQCDLTVPHSHDFIGSVDIVFCYGTLYHLHNPEIAIKDLARVTKGILLLETCVFREDNGQINPAREHTTTINQAVRETGCRPGRDWIVAALREYFPHVYVTATQPDHRDFPLAWPAPDDDALKRSVFVASREKMTSPLLLDVLPEKQII